jgi:hypothetical protein
MPGSNSVVSTMARLPGLHQALVDGYERDARVIDPRIQLMPVNAVTKMLRDVGVQISGRELGDADALRQQLSDLQPHAKAFRAYAEDLRSGVPLAISADRVMRLLGDQYPALTVAFGVGHVGVVVSPDDSIRMAQPGEVVHQ